MDPITAMAVATSAINGIKKGIELAKDTSEIAQELDKFFTAKNVVEEEAKKEQSKTKKSKNLNQVAMANVMNRKKLREAEKKLKEQLYWSGQADLWDELQAERIRLRRAQQKADEEAAYRKRVIIQRIRDGIIICGILAVTAVILVNIIDVIMTKEL
ncbi:MAG: hypothetical protein EB168_10390 [Euryarchaeota archaeon]|jgi:hypothetical protein|nr:hypothetical protein [Euryarchaeota archaeon]